MSVAGVAAAGLHVGDDGRPVGDDRAELVDVERDAELVGDREQVEDAVGRAAGGRDGGDRVLDGGLGHEVLRPDVAPDEVHDDLAAAVGGRVLARILGRDGVEAGRRETDELEDGGHRVGRELAAAGAGAGTGRVLDLVQLVERDLAGPVRADGLVDGDDGRVPLALVDAGIDRAVVEDEARDVEAAHGHRRTGHGLVAADQADEAVEEVAADDELDRDRR